MITNFYELCRYYIGDLTDDECDRIRLLLPTLASPQELATEVHSYMRDVMGVDKPMPDIAT
jgi:hypothetical protein